MNKDVISSPDDPFDRRELELEKPYRITYLKDVFISH